jgi:hypothetical protein
MVGLLPDGGRGYERPEWTDGDRQTLTERFFASPFGRPLDSLDHRGLLANMLWFGCDYGPGDPMRWSPVAVDIILGDWIPRKLGTEVSYLAKAPELLRAFVRFCHSERRIPGHLTEETLRAIDESEPDYQATIRSPRPQGVHALLAAAVGLVAFDSEDRGGRPGAGEESGDYRTIMRGFLERAVGGPAALDALDDSALPDEPFDWSEISHHVRERVTGVLALCDSCCDELLGGEYRTACRRVLARVAANGPEVFLRGRADTAAAAICWAVCRVNDRFDQRQGGFTQKALLSHFGLQSGGVASRAGTLLDAGGFPRHGDDFALGSPHYLVSTRRRAILDRLAWCSDPGRPPTSAGAVDQRPPRFLIDF